jgi:beta-N-acetylhexosaminidase
VLSIICWNEVQYMKKIILLLMAVILAAGVLGGCLSSTPQQPVLAPPEDVPQSEPEVKDPIKEKIKEMTPEEKLGQMMIVGLEGYELNEDAKILMDSFHVGGFILFGSNIQDAPQLLKYVNELKSYHAGKGVPLFVSVDEEGGRISRVPKTIKNLPTGKAIGRADNQDYSFEVGQLLAQKVSAFGFNMDFAPVLDINSNPKNPVIGDRSFGAEEAVVSRLGVQIMKGIQSKNVIPVVKHFPGHGDTAVDSHVGLTSVGHDLSRLERFELIPFGEAIKKGADCVMAAHILLPQIDRENPATLSKTIITDILRQQLGFQGVVITDDMTMGAITKHYEIGAAAVKSVTAGVDIVLVAHEKENAAAVFDALKAALEEGKIAEERIDQSLYRILALKEKYGLRDQEAGLVDIEGLNRKITQVLNKYHKK